MSNWITLNPPEPEDDVVWENEVKFQNAKREVVGAYIGHNITQQEAIFVWNVDYLWEYPEIVVNHNGTYGLRSKGERIPITFQTQGRAEKTLEIIKKGYVQ